MASTSWVCLHFKLKACMLSHSTHIHDYPNVKNRGHCMHSQRHCRQHALQRHGRQHALTAALPPAASLYSLYLFCYCCTDYLEHFSHRKLEASAVVCSLSTCQVGGSASANGFWHSPTLLRKMGTCRAHGAKCVVSLQQWIT